MSGKDSSDNRNSSTFSGINWKRETLLVIFGAILGGLVFTAVSPFVVPTIHDIQVHQFGVQKPTLGVEVDYASGVSGERFSVSDNETYDRYTVTIQNPSDKRVSTLTVGTVFPGVIEAQRVEPATTGISYSNNVELVATDSPENFSLASNGIRVSEIPPLKEVSATFLIDTTPEKGLAPGYWNTRGLDEYNASRGSIMISGQYRWQFKGSTYTEFKPYSYTNASKNDSPRKYDICVGKSSEKVCEN